MFKEILIGVSAAVLATALIVAVLPSTSTDITTSPAPAATEAPPAAAPAVAPEPRVEDEECYLTSSCLLQNGWTMSDWVYVATEGVAEGWTEEFAGCAADVFMLNVTPTGLLSLSDAEIDTLASIAAAACHPLFEAAFGSQQA